MKKDNFTKIQIKLIAKLPEIEDFEKIFDIVIADAINSIGGEVIDSKEYEKQEQFYLIKIDTYLPNNFNESLIDNLLADVILENGGELIDSKEYEKIS